MNEKEWPLLAGTDFDDVELRHKKWEISPLCFKTTVDQIHKTFAHARTHFHIGLPSKTVSPEISYTIARAVEMRIVLALTEAGFIEEPEKVNFFSEAPVISTTLIDTNQYRTTGRGVISLGVDEWVTPTLSHNLELRMHLGIRHGLDLIQFVTYLSQNHEKLLEPRFEFYLDKKKFGSFNLAGALIYAASLFEESGEAQETIKRMRLLSKNIENNCSVENIQEVISFLINCKANQILGNPDLYLHKD